MMTDIFTPGLVLLGAAVIIGAYLFLRAGRNRIDSLLPASVPLFICLILSACLFEFFRGQYSDWDASRLAVAVGASKDHQVYATLTSGAVQTTMYPPAWILAYLPVALGKTPTAVMMIGYALAQLFSLVPVAIMCSLLARQRLVAFTGFAIFVFFLIRSLPLELACFLPHADAPALGLALLSLLTLHRGCRKPEVSRSTVICASLFACASVATKQTTLPLLPAILLWCYWAHGFRIVARLFLSSLIVGLIMLAASILWAGGPALYLNLVKIPGSCPWTGTFPYNLFSGLLDLSKLAVIPLILCFAGGAVSMASAEKQEDIRQRLWPLLLFCGLLLIPTSVLGRIKVGGAPSAFAPALYFLYLAALAATLEAMSRLDRAGSTAVASARKMLAGAALVIGATWTLMVVQELRYRVPAPSENLSQEAYAFLKTGKTSACFPAYPLAHLLAEDKLYHFSQAIADRESLAGMAIGEAQRKAYYPADPEIICWSSRLFDSERLRVPQLFADYDRRTPIPELPSFICFRRNSSETAMPTNGK